MSNKYTFPEGFWWGSATSGPQSEGILISHIKMYLIIGMK